MLIEPGEHHAKIHLYLLAVELFTKVLFPIVHFIAERVEEKKQAKTAPAQADAPGEAAAPPEEQENTQDAEEQENTQAPEEQENTQEAEEQLIQEEEKEG